VAYAISVIYFIVICHSTRLSAPNVVHERKPIG